MIPICFEIHWSVLLVLIAVPVILIYLWFKRGRNRIKAQRDAYALKQWKSISKLWGQKSPEAYKLAIIEADKLLDYAFKKMQFSGADFGERLRGACHKYEYLKDIWFAHNLRNDIVHKSYFELSPSAANKALHFYERALDRLGFLS
ncbi:MAG TPA: hypothetical protein PLB38_01320 [bacterium]|nr:hypothetical protein [bacterium]